MDLKEYIEKLTDIKVTKDNIEEIRGLISEAEEGYKSEISKIDENKEQRKFTELRDAIDDLKQLKGLLEQAEGLVVNVQSEIEDEGESEEEQTEETGENEQNDSERSSEEIQTERNIQIGEKEKEEVRSIKGEREERSEKNMTIRKMAKGNNKSYRDLFNNYLRNQEIAEGLTTDDEGVILDSEEIMGSDYERTEALDVLVDNIPVDKKSGKHYEPDLSGAEGMKTVEELAKSPENSGIGFNETDYSVVTYREAFRYANELKDDMKDFDKYIVELTEEVVRLTKNREILKAINDNKDIETKTFSTVADFITPGIKSKYRKGFVVSETMYNRLARMKDSEGRFLLHNDLTKDVTTRILGKPVNVKPDDEVGENTFIYGDLKEAVKFFNRQEVTVKWVEHQYWGTVLQPVIRFDVQVVKPEAIIKIEIDLNEESEGTETVE